MNTSPLICERLARTVVRSLDDAEVGYCLRVDHLDAEDATTLCRMVRDGITSRAMEAWVLTTAGEGDGLEITPERAIEVRNRKQVRLALIVPAGIMDVAASSLTNSFASFDLQDFWRETAKDLLSGLPENLQSLVRRVLTTMRGVMVPHIEQQADYLAAVASSPTPETAGAEMWRVGLIPDLGGETCVDRLERNLKCVRELVRPARSHTSAAERIGACDLRDGPVKTELLTYLGRKCLRDSRAWLEPLAHDPHRGRITFETWTFVQGQESNLERIEVSPLLDDEGQVRPNTGFRQSEPGTQPVAPIGPKSKIKIKWESTPKTPSNLKRWKAEIIPSRECYSEDDAPAVELPQARVSAKSRQASIPLDIELPEDTSVGAQVRIVGLDEHDNELADAENVPIEGLSEEFWLSYADAPPPPDEGGRRSTVSNLPMARLHAAQSLPIEAIEEAPGEWTVRDLHYFTIRLNGRYAARLGVSPVLRKVEQLAVENTEGAGCFHASVEGNGTLDPDTDLEAVKLAALENAELGRQFLDRRGKFLRKLREQEHRGLVEVADWTSDLSQRAVACATAYAKLLDEETSPEVLWEALRVDSLHLEIEIGGRLEPSVLILPTHPLRLLWYAAYVDLLRAWEEDLLKHEKKARVRVLDLDLLGQVEPMHCPAFTHTGTKDLFLFAQNLRFFWGIALPLSVRNPARRVANIAQALALSEDEASITDLPPEKVSQEFFAYHEVHRYLETLRVNVWNPGVGTFAAQALRGFYTSGRSKGQSDEEGDDVAAPPPRLELFAHVPPPVPATLPALSKLQQELYEARPRGRHHHLAPFFSIAIREENQADKIPGGDVNLSLVMDRLQPTVRLVDDDARGSSCSLFGLMVRMLPRFASGPDGVRWEHRLQPVVESSTARHPNKAYTPALAHLHSSILAAVGRVLEPTLKKGTPAVVVDLPVSESRLIDAVHSLSDWVITLDRFFGVEFYDAPSDPSLSAVAQKYLLDYAPEFLDGMGHRMLVTTTHREEVEEILARAMRELGFKEIEDSVGKVLRHLKTISGRLALRVLGDEGRAREAVSLGVVAAYLESQGELNDAILVPVDSHPELFGPTRKNRSPRDSAARCDLLRVQLRQNRLVATFVEVKSRSGGGNSEELANRIVDQIEATEKVFQDLFFQDDPRRIDQVLQRARLATILHFYLQRAVRYGLINSEEIQSKMEEAIGRLESGIAQLRVLRWGFIVNLEGQPQRPLHLRDAEIRFLTTSDVLDAGFSVSHDGGSGKASRDVASKAAGELPPQTPAPQQPVVPVPPAPAPGGAGNAVGQTTKLVEPKSPKVGQVQETPTGVGKSPPPCSREIVEVELGNNLDGEAVVWRSSVRGSPHLFIVGIPGQGKSVTTTRILCELARQGLSALVIDFHGQFGNAGSPFAKRASPAVLDVTKGLPFSPFEAETDQSTGASWWQNNCFAVAEIFEYVCGLGDMQRDVVFEALRDCYIDLGFQEGSAQRFPTLDEFRTRLEELEEERGIRNVIPRCRPLLEFGLFPAAKTDVELGDLLQRGLVVDVSNLGVEALQMASGAFVLRKVYKDMFLWGEADRLRLAIVLDEAHRLAKDITLPKIMKEGRKFGVAVVVASQGLSDYHPDVVGNAGTKVVFRTNFPMSKKVAGFLRAPKGVDLAEAIEQLDVGEAFVQTPEMNSCARVRMNPRSDHEE